MNIKATARSVVRQNIARFISISGYRLNIKPDITPLESANLSALLTLATVANGIYLSLTENEYLERAKRHFDKE